MLSPSQLKHAQQCGLPAIDLDSYINLNHRQNNQFRKKYDENKKLDAVIYIS